MVYDLISNWRYYAWPGERFAAAFSYLESLAADSPDGRVEIDGDNVFCMVQAYETKPRDGARYEAHRDYADIQVLLDGSESVLWAPQNELTVVQPYEPDIEFYALDENPADIVLSPGRFVVLYPQDAHAPCLHHVRQQNVRKAVIKIKL